ncbi:MAG TPA: SRPBCC family protein [Miltoncostaeaceae bacterium]|nr:SRPBCC family protein [Miltoncostaeaceae bacterium]
MPRTSVYERSVEIAAPATALFRFHLDTRNAPLISPAAARFARIEGRFPVTVGSLVTLKVRQPPIPIAQTWRVRIAEIRPDRLVVDVAERSPFALWRHAHIFDEVGPGRTRMTDRVEYALPFGPLGRLVDRLFARRQLEGMFEERHRRTKELFESGDLATAPVG